MHNEPIGVDAAIDFHGSIIKKIEVSNQEPTLALDTPIQFKMDLLDPRMGLGKNSEGIEYWDCYLEIDVQADIVIDSDDATSSENPAFRIAMEGRFTAPTEIDAGALSELLQINGAAALYSVLRTEMMHLSASTFLSGKITLPMLNFVSIYENSLNERKEEPAENSQA